MLTSRTRARRAARGGAALLLMTSLWAWGSSRDASAQASPVVTITHPAPGATVSGTIPVTATVGGVGSLFVVGVQFTLDGAALGAEDPAAPYSISWSTGTTSNGSHTLRAVARDMFGMRWTSDPVTVTVLNDATPPAVSIATPSSGAVLSATITVEAAASDNVGVAGVQFRVDGAPLGAEDTSAPYSISWDTRTATNGSHTLTAIARDAAGNVTTAGPVTVTVDNAVADTTAPTVTMTAPSGGSTVSGTVAVSADASDNVGVAGVRFRLDGADLGAEDTTAPYTVSWDTRAAANGSHSLTAIARDAAGNVTTAGPVTVTVDNTVPDTTAPTVTMTSPSGGSTVSGTVVVSADASDNVGVAGVRFRLDGADLGAEDTAAPYTVSWDTRTAANGSHSLTAIARDAAGNVTTAGPVTVTVDNTVPDTTAPTVTMTAPSGGSTVSGTVAVSADASDNVGVAGVRFRLDGGDLGVEDTVAPYAVSWDTRTATNGVHTLLAIARDAAGNSTTSGSVTVTVDNPPSGTRTFQPGDVVVSLEPGNVLWFLPDGTPHAVLTPGVPGAGEGMAFDSAGNLYISRWCNDPACSNGNTVEKLDTAGRSLGAVGSGYNCAPHTLVFDPAGVAYVGQAGCAKSILKFMPGTTAPVEYAAAEEFYGIFWLDLAPNRCTLFYTSYGPNVKRFDVCAGVQLTDFNVAPLPGSAQDLRVLPDGGLLVSSGDVIARLDAAGMLVRTYTAPAGSAFWAGLDLVGDGTFWVINYSTSDVHRFDLATGAVVDTFNTGTPPSSAVAVRVKR